MKTKEDIQAAILAFLEGGDKRNKELLSGVLHADFRSTVNRFAGCSDLLLIPKETYLTWIEQGKIGGSLRTVISMDMEVAGYVAAAKVKMQSEKVAFTSFYGLILNQRDEWQLISDLPFASPI